MPTAAARPLTGSILHFRADHECQATIVVALREEYPLAPDYTLDLMVMVPRRPNAESNRPGQIRWANDVNLADVEHDVAGTWHWPGAGCVPRITNIPGE